MYKKIGIGIAALTFSLSCTSAVAQFAKAEDAIKYRESAMTLIGSHFGRMGPVAKQAVSFDAEQIKASVAILNTLATLPWAAFPDGSQGNSRSRDEVWSDPQGFKQAQDKFLASLEKLTAAAESGDFDAFRVGFGTVGQSCKACHDSYRKRR
jgi:cytochrome c556